jgi:hypothetical protein
MCLRHPSRKITQPASPQRMHMVNKEKSCVQQLSLGVRPYHTDGSRTIRTQDVTLDTELNTLQSEQPP